jgi:hypothetical protein
MSYEQHTSLLHPSVVRRGVPRRHAPQTPLEDRLPITIVGKTRNIHAMVRPDIDMA